MVLFLYLPGRRTSRCRIEILAVCLPENQPIGHQPHLPCIFSLRHSYPSYPASDPAHPDTFLHVSHQASLCLPLRYFCHLVCPHPPRNDSKKGSAKVTRNNCVSRLPESQSSFHNQDDSVPWTTKTKPRKQHKPLPNSSHP